MVRFAIYAASMVLLGALTAQPAESALIGVIGSSARTLDLPESNVSEFAVRFPVAVDAVTDGATVGAELVSLALGERVLDFDPDWLTYVTDAERSDRAALALRIPAGTLRTAGTYTLTIEFWKRTALPEPQYSDEGSLTLTLTRPAGALVLDEPLSIERVIYIPFLPGYSVMNPAAFTLSETSGRNQVQIQSPNETNEAIVELRSNTSSATVARLLATLPGVVDAGRRESVAIALDGPTPLSTVAGTLRILSEQLEPRLLTATVEVTTRLSHLWLLAVIAFGILMGFFVRVLLEGRKGRALARAAARRVAADIEDAVRETVDEKYRQELKDALAPLRAVLARKTASGDDLASAATAAKEAVTGILGQLEAKHVELATLISNHRAALAVATGITHMTAFTELEQLLRDAEAAIECANVTAADKLLDSLGVRLLDVGDALRDRAGSLARLVSEAMDWPEVEADLPANATLASIAESVAGADGLVPAVSSAEVDAAATASIAVGVRKLEQLTSDVADRLDRRAEGIEDYAQTVRRDMTDIGDAEGRALDDALARFGAARKAETADIAGLGRLMTAERELHGVIARHIRPGARSRRMRGASLQRPPDLEERVLPPADGWSVRVVPIGIASRGLPVELVAEIATADGASRPVVRSATWRINNRSVTASADGLSCRYTPGAGESKLDVQVDVTGEGAVGQTTVATARTMIVVQRASDREIADELERRAAVVSGMQTLLAGALIAFAGYTIFEGSFVGTVTDIASALFWGFGIDITVAKALEYSTPLTGQALPEKN